MPYKNFNEEQGILEGLIIGFLIATAIIGLWVLSLLRG